VFSKSDVNAAEVFKACRVGEWAEQHPIRINIKAAECFPGPLQPVAATCDDEFIRFTLVMEREKIFIERSEQKNSGQ
jgi:hypothetical protein